MEELKPPEPEDAEESEEVEESAARRGSLYVTAGYVNIYTWGVRDRAGEWVSVKGDPWRAEYEAKNITHRAALAIFESHPNAFQLIDGCDVWACLSDELEVFVVKKEKSNVPADESLPGAGTASDGPGHSSEAHSPAEDSTPGDD